MSTRSDPLVTVSEEGPDRLYYAQGVLLDAQDFNDEQTYHRGRVARGLAYLFGTGTVAGLRVDYDATTEELVVQPGLAIDPLGRLIEIPRPRCVRLRNWFAVQRSADVAGGWLSDGAASLLIADVFVRFVVGDHGKTPAFAAGPFDALDAVAPSRLRDGVELGLVIRGEAGLRRQALLDGDPNPPVIPVPDARMIELGLPADPSARLDAIEDLMFTAWRDGTSDWDGAIPPRFVEHLSARVLPPNPDQSPAIDYTAVGRDPTAVLLARVQLGVDTTDAAAIRYLSFTSSASNPDNRLRRFIYYSGYATRPASRGAP